MAAFGIGAGVMKRCGHCKEEKVLSFFAKNRASPDGYQGYCKNCSRASVKKNYDANKDKYKQKYQENKKAILARQKKYRNENLEMYKELDRIYRLSIKGRSMTLFNAVKARCRQFGHELELCPARIEFALLVGKCERTGIPFVLEKHESRMTNPYSPSVDRKDSTKGYTYSNVQIVCTAYNLAKNQMTDNEFLDFCKVVVATAK